MCKLRSFLILGLALLLGGCKAVMLDPKGIIAAHEKSLLIDSTLLMLIVVVPVIILSFIFAWRYRARNKTAKHSPEWGHSNAIEGVMWSIPIVIVAILAVMTWISSHRLDPFKPIASKKKTIAIQVVALDWRWLFVYPKQHIASINYLRIPVNTPVRFDITADAPMNAFVIPALAGQIYAMAGMHSQLHILATANGRYIGRSVNFSGDGFSKMKFIAQVTSAEDFNRWVARVQESSHKLTWAQYNKLAAPSEDTHVQSFTLATNNLFKRIIMKYTQPQHLVKGHGQLKVNS